MYSLDQSPFLNGNQIPQQPEGILGYDLMVGLSGMTRMLGKSKVAVGFHGDNAYVTQERNYVNLPAIPSWEMVPVKVANRIRGFAAHETAHLLFTDFDAKNRYFTEEEQKDPLLHSIWNSIEDFMIEFHWMKEFSGSKRFFTETEKYCSEKYLEQYAENPDVAKDLRSIGPVALTWCRGVYFKLDTDASQKALDTLPEKLRNKAWEWFKDVRKVRDTKQACKLALKIRSEIENDPIDENDPPQGDQSNPQQDQNSSQNQGQGQGQSQSPQSNGNQNSQSSAQKNTGKAQSDQSSSEKLKDKIPAPDVYQVGYDINQDDEVKKAANPDKGAPGNGHQPTKKVPGNIVFSSKDTGPYQNVLSDPNGGVTAQSILRSMGGVSGTISSVLKKTLVSITRSKTRGGKTFGKLDDARLAHAFLGSQDVYKQKRDGQKIDTAVSVLLDLSGSMDVHLELVQQISLIMNDALAATPIKYEILGYTSYPLSGDSKEFLDQQADAICASGHESFDRHNDIDEDLLIYQFKSFNDRPQDAKQIIGNMTNIPMRSTTPTGHAMKAAHSSLTRQKQKRHVMIIVTDGRPNDEEAAQEAVRMLEATQTSIVAIGIRESSVRKMTDNYVVVNDTADLVQAFVNKLSGVLFDQRGWAAKKNQYLNKSMQLPKAS